MGIRITEPAFFKKFRKGHAFMPYDEKSGAAAKLVERPSRIEVYLPCRDLELEGMLNILPSEGDYKFGNGIAGRSLESYDFTKDGLSRPNSSWITYGLAEIPDGATKFSVSCRGIDSIVNANDMLITELNRYIDDMSSIRETDSDSRSRMYMIRVTDYLQYRLDELCEDILLRQIKKIPKRKHLNTDSSIK